MASQNQNTATNPNIHLAANSNNGVLLHNAEIAGNNGSVSAANDVTSSDANSAAALNKGPQSKAVQVSVSGCRFSNPA